MTTHSSILAWRIPQTEEPGGLQSMGSHRVGHDRSDLAAAAATNCNWERNVIKIHIMQDMDTAVQLGQWNPFLAWTPKEEVLFLPKLENELLLRLHHCGVVRARAGVQWPATGS